MCDACDTIWAQVDNFELGINLIYDAVYELRALWLINQTTFMILDKYLEDMRVEFKLVHRKRSGVRRCKYA